MLKNGRIYPGTPLTVTCTFQDECGVLVDPDTVTFKTISPSGREARNMYGESPIIYRSAAGIYKAELAPDEAGRWHYRWESTGVGAATVHEDSFIVLVSRFSPYQFARDYS